METQALDTLVKLASLGTAGICVVIIVVAGILIYKLPKGTDDNKISLIKTFIKTNVFIAIICAVSGVANAYFNQGKIEEAKKETTQVVDKYEKQRVTWEKDRAELKNGISLLKSELNNYPQISPETQNKLNNIQTKVNTMEIKSLKSINR